MGNTTEVIAHERPHPLGIRDKYDGGTVFPKRYAAPSQRPLFPPEKAESIALDRPVATTKDAPAMNLSECVVDKITAAQMNWVRTTPQIATSDPDV
ncbi:MAG: hypothetical protein MK538_01755 [Planctomycetes bacterium]|nr:hypothetical protein [Planctomycetota bacterium]